MYVSPNHPDYERLKARGDDDGAPAAGAAPTGELVAHWPRRAGKGGEEELTEGGLGIAIIRSVADEVEIEGGPEGRGSRLRFVKLL